jgi:hypothetical protein
MGSLSVCPSIKTAISGFSPNTLPNHRFLPSDPTDHYLVEKQFVLHRDIYFTVFCSTVSPLPSNPFKALDKVSLTFALLLLLQQSVLNSCKRCGFCLLTLVQWPCALQHLTDNKSRFLFMFAQSFSTIFSKVVTPATSSFYLLKQRFNNDFRSDFKLIQFFNLYLVLIDFLACNKAAFSSATLLVSFLDQHIFSLIVYFFLKHKVLSNSTIINKIFLIIYFFI